MSTRITTIEPHPLVVDLKGASRLTGYSVDTLRTAVHTTDLGAWPPPLRGKRDSRGRITVKTADLLAWHDAFEDA